MKKFIKAIAFVTVMCMALSTVAFAAAEGTATQDATDYKQVNVTVTGASKDEQVALLIVPKGAGTSSATIHYIDQKAAVETAGGDVEASFTAPLDVTDGTEVDVYVGYSSKGAAINLGTFTISQPTTEITITKTKEAEVVDVAAESDLGYACALKFTVDAPEGVSAKQMVWAIEYTPNGAAESKMAFSDAIDVSSYGIGTIVSGSVTLGVAFSNGSVEREIKAATINSVDAIFLFTDGTVKANDDKDFGQYYVQK